MDPLRRTMEASKARTATAAAKRRSTSFPKLLIRNDQLSGLISAIRSANASPKTRIIPTPRTIRNVTHGVFRYVIFRDKKYIDNAPIKICKIE